MYQTATENNGNTVPQTKIGNTGISISNIELEEEFTKLKITLKVTEDIPQIYIAFSTDQFDLFKAEEDSNVIFANTKPFLVTKFKFYKPALEEAMKNVGSVAQTATRALSVGLMVVSLPSYAAILKFLQVIEILLYLNVLYPRNVKIFLKMSSYSIFEDMPNPLSVFSDSKCEIPYRNFTENDYDCQMLANTGGSLIFILALLAIKLIPMAYLRSRNNKMLKNNDGVDLKQQQEIDYLTKSTILADKKNSGKNKVSKCDRFMMKLNNFLSSNFFLMMVHGLQLDLYISLLVNLTANMKKSTPNGINIFFSVLIGLSLILYSLIIHALTKTNMRSLRRKKQAEQIKTNKEKGDFKIMDISQFDFGNVDDEEGKPSSKQSIHAYDSSDLDQKHPLPALGEIYRPSIRWPLHPHTLSSIKPLIIAAIVVLLYTKPFFQTGLLFGFFACQTVILVKYRVYATKRMNKVRIVSSVFTTINFAFFFYLHYKSIEYNTGWILIIVICTGVVWNWGNECITLMRDAAKSCKCLRKKQKKQVIKKVSTKSDKLNESGSKLLSNVNTPTKSKLPGMSLAVPTTLTLKKEASNDSKAELSIDENLRTPVNAKRKKKRRKKRKVNDPIQNMMKNRKKRLNSGSDKPSKIKIQVR